MKKISLFVIATLISVATFGQTSWKVDPMHSFVNFSIKHMGISFVDGLFTKFDGSIKPTKADLTDAKINFTVDVNSVNTTVAKRDEHLRTADFFDVQKFPTMTFVSTSFVKRNVKPANTRMTSYILKGKLTIKDVTKDVVFVVTFGGMAKDNQGNNKIGFAATTSINRLDYNINYDPTGMALANNVEIKLNLEFTETK